jgi:hypothetical protein
MPLRLVKRYKNGPLAMCYDQPETQVVLVHTPRQFAKSVVWFISLTRNALDIEFCPSQRWLSREISPAFLERPIRLLLISTEQTNHRVSD